MAYPHHGRVAALLRLSEGVHATLQMTGLPSSRRGHPASFRNKFRIPDTQSLLHAIAQSLASEGFRKEVIGTRFECVGTRDLSAHRRDERNRNSRGCRVASDNLTDGKAVNVRQSHVQQDEIRCMTADECEAVRPGFSGKDFEACFSQVILNQFDEVRFVVNHQNLGRHIRALAQGERAEQRRESESVVTNWRRWHRR